MDCFVVPAFIVIAIFGRTVSFHLTYVGPITKKHNYVNGQEICYRIFGMQAILANYRLTLVALAWLGLDHSVSLIDTGLLLLPLSVQGSFFRCIDALLGGGFRVGCVVNAAGAMLTFCWDILLG